MIEFTRVNHVGFVVADLDAQVQQFQGLFGLGEAHAWEAPDESARGVTFGLPGGLAWELAAPTSEESPLQEFLDSPRGPGIHHVTFEVADLAAAREECRRLGIREGRGSSDRLLVISADGAGEGIQFRFVAEGEQRVPSTSAGDDGPSLGIEALDHVCIAYRDRDELSRHYERLLGFRQIWRTPDGAWPDFGDCVLEIPGDQMHWEIIQPVGEESFIQGFLDRRGPAPHHVAFRVRDFDAALAACEHYGVPTFDEHDDQTDGHRWRDAFIHPKHTGGLLTQIYWEAHPGVWERSDKVRPEAYAG